LKNDTFKRINLKKIWFNRGHPGTGTPPIGIWPGKKKLVKFTDTSLKLASPGVSVKQLGSTARECLWPLAKRCLTWSGVV
jgi:hypothetical protein